MSARRAQREGPEPGCSYRQILQSPMGVIETDVSIERLDDCPELTLRCLDTGTHAHWLQDSIDALRKAAASERAAA